MPKLLKELKDKRDLAIEYRKQVWDDDAKRALNYYLYGTHRDLGHVSINEKEKRKRKANMIFSTIEGIMPKMFDRVPGFQAMPGGQDDVEKAPKVEKVLKYKVEQLDFEVKAEDASRDMLVPGFGMWKLTWGFLEDDKKKKGEEDELPQVIEDDLNLEVVDPFDFWITAGDHRIRDAEGCFQRMFLTMDEAERKYPKAKSLKATHIVGELNQTKKERFGKQAERVIVWEYHGHIDGKEQVIVFTDEEKLQDRKPYKHGRRPFIMLPNYRMANEFYPRGEVFNLEPLQEELIEIDIQMSNFRKRAINPKKYVQKGAFANDVVDANRMRDPRINYVELNDINAVKWENPPVIGQDLYNMRNIKKEDMSLMSGINEISRGGTERVVKTATGQQILYDASEGRVRQKVRILSRAMKELLYQMQGLLAEFQDKEDVVRITDDSEGVFENYTKEDMQGRFDFIIDVVETMPLLREKRGQLAIEAYNLFKDDPEIDQANLKKKVAKLAFGDIGAEELIIEPEPEEEVMPEVSPEAMGMPQGMPPMPVPQEAAPMAAMGL